MIIGITRGSEETIKKIGKIIENNYGYKYIDCNRMLKEMLYAIELEKIKVTDWYKCNKIFSKVKNQMNTIINDELENNKNLVIGFSLLEELQIFDSCDIKIKNISEQKNMNNNFDVYLKDIEINIDSKYDNSEYQLILNDEVLFEQKIKEWFENKVFNSTKVTVVIPIYNTENYISRIVKSVTNQTYKNLEILLIDDGSTDNSLKICQMLASKDSRIKVIHQNNIGLAETRNKGISMATGEYIAFFDSDDYIESNMIESLVNKIKLKNAAVCQGGFWIHMKNGMIKDVTIEQSGDDFFENSKEIIEAHSNHLISIAAWDKIYKLSEIKNVKFDKNVAKEDADFVYKLCMAGKSFAIVSKPFYHYIKRNSNSITAEKISYNIFKLQNWGHKAYDEILSRGYEYRDAAEKILYNSLVHILRNYMRDYKNKVLEKNEYKEEIQSVAYDLLNLLLHCKDVKKFRKLNEVLDILNQLIDDNIIDKEKMPIIDVPCIGILWNSLNQNMREEALTNIIEKAELKKYTLVDLKETYEDFIKELYAKENDFLGISSIKAGTLIDRYDTNNIAILNLIVRVSNYKYYNDEKGFMFKEIAELKSAIRNKYRNQIKNYAYDNVFHLTTDEDDYNITNKLCKKYVRKYTGE